MQKDADSGGKFDFQKFLDLENKDCDIAFAERLGSLRQKRGMSKTELAKRLYTHPSVVEKFEAGFLPKGEHAVALARVLKCSLYWLLMGEDPPGQTARDEAQAIASFSKRAQPAGAVKPIKIAKHARPDPEASDCIPCVHRFFSIENNAVVLSAQSSTHFSFRKSWLEKIATDPGNVVLVRLEGNSMEPTLCEGDMVMLDIGRNRSIKAGFIYALGIGGTIVFKRLEPLDDHRIRIISDRKTAYPPYECKIDDIHILGRAIWFARRIVPIAS